MRTLISCNNTCAEGLVILCAVIVCFKRFSKGKGWDVYVFVCCKASQSKEYNAADENEE